MHKNEILKMLSGLISETEFKEQKEWYDSQLNELTQQLTESRTADKTKSRQIDDMQEYIKAIDDILKFNEENEMVYREILVSSTSLLQRLQKQTLLRNKVCNNDTDTPISLKGASYLLIKEVSTKGIVSYDVLAHTDDDAETTDPDYRNRYIATGSFYYQPSEIHIVK